MPTHHSYRDEDVCADLGRALYAVFRKYEFLTREVEVFDNDPNVRLVFSVEAALSRVLTNIRRDRPDLLEDGIGRLLQRLAFYSGVAITSRRYVFLVSRAANAWQFTRE